MYIVCMGRSKGQRCAYKVQGCCMENKAQLQSYYTCVTMTYVYLQL